MFHPDTHYFVFCLFKLLEADASCSVTVLRNDNILKKIKKIKVIFVSAIFKTATIILTNIWKHLWTPCDLWFCIYWYILLSDCIIYYWNKKKKKILLYILRITHTIQGGYQTHTHTTLDLRVDNFKTKFVSEFDRPALEHNTICKCSQ